SAQHEEEARIALPAFRRLASVLHSRTLSPIAGRSPQEPSRAPVPTEPLPVFGPRARERDRRGDMSEDIHPSGLITAPTRDRLRTGPRARRAGLHRGIPISGPRSARATRG